MPGRQWRAAFALLAAGALVGAAIIVIVTEVDRRTSTDAFCTSCHSMAAVAADPHFKQSVHENNSAGLRTRCGDCHIPPGNWLEETFSHVSLGIRDVLAEYTHNFSDAAVWEKQRTQLAAKVRDEMRRSDSMTCRKCHDATAIRPTSEAGRAAHALLQQGRMSCIECHIDLAHAPAAAASGLIGGSGLR
jgi:nitrate/TMAO reductase-like tetraheme cytochrome c subunit